MDRIAGEFSDELFKSAFKYAAIGMALVSPEGKWLKVNKATCKIVGYSEAELLKIDFQTITHPDDLENDLHLLNELVSGKRHTYQMEKRYFHKDGSVVWINLSVSLIRDDKGQPKFFISQIQDISEAKEKQEQLDLVYSATMDGYWDWFIKDNYQYMSPRFWEIFGYESHEKEHHPREWQKLIFKEDLESAIFNFKQHVNSRGAHPFFQEVRYHHKDGSTVWVICRGKIVQWDENGEPVRMAGTISDVTDLKKVQRELEEEKARQSLNTRLASLGQMAGGIAHEINNPLAILMGHSDLLVACSKKEHIPIDKIQNSAETIRKTVDRIATVIRGLRNFARDGSDDEFEEFEITPLLDEVLSLCADRYKRHEINLEVSEGFKNKVIYGQKTQVGQVLINLINNGFDAVKNLEERWLKIEFKETSEYSEISVEDSGDGLPFDVKENLMKPFFTTKKKGEGTGIGLSISKNIVEKHFGDLFYDQDCANTRFVVRFPKKDRSISEVA